MSANTRMNEAIAIDATAIVLAKNLGYRLSNQSDDLRETLGKLEDELQKLSAASFNDDMRKILDRIEDVRRLRNAMELGAFAIQINRVMDAAYERLP